ncbi:MAG: sulfite exporter TauE/SafE family protein [Spirochaetaceae bacterium]|nr:sulfite exporter TauE/SafE family protein [Spirochaetaceae bacterium]
MTLPQIAAAAITAILLGVSRAGLSTISLLTLPILSQAFGGRSAVGLVLPIAIGADLTGVFSNFRNLRWKPLLVILPGTLVGVALGAWLGMVISDEVFKIIIGSVIILSLLTQGYRDFKGRRIIEVEPSPQMATLVGIVGGFTSMVGNAAGAVILIYFLALGLPKKNYIACWGWFFFIVNSIKVIPHVFLWKSITPGSLLIGAIMIPGILAGALLGRLIVKRIPEKPFRITLLVMTFLATFLLFL